MHQPLPSLALNIFSTLKAALKQVHGAGTIDATLSHYYLEIT
jgi:hypothetical protein